MSSKILTDKGGKVIYRTSVWPLSAEKSHNETFTAQREQFNANLKAVLGARFEGMPIEEDEAEEDGTDTPFYDAYEDDEQENV